MGKESDDCGPKPLFPKKPSHETIPSKDSFFKAPSTNVTAAVLSLSGTSLEMPPGKECSPTRKVITMNQVQPPEVIRPNLGQLTTLSVQKASSVIKPVLNRSTSRINIFKWFERKTDEVVKQTECADMNRRIKKMSWGAKPAIRPVQSVRSFIVNVCLLGIKAGIVSGLCCYTAQEGLWGTHEETQMFYSNLIHLVVNGGGETPTKESLMQIVKDIRDKTNI